MYSHISYNTTLEFYSKLKRGIMKKNAFYAQSGGVTSVINATAASVILESKNINQKLVKFMLERMEFRRT